MKSSDLTASILIVIIFILLYAFNFFVVGFQKIKDNWPLYRCNPVIMPFASIFGFNAKQNFSYCIQNMQKDYMGYLMMPMNYNMNVLGSVGGNLSGNITGIRAMFNKVRNMGQSLIQSLFGVFLNIIIEFQRMMINIKDMTGKLMGIMATLLYTLDGSISTMNSAWSGLPGQLTRALCFHPETLLRLANGDLVQMQHVALNAQLASGSIVYARMEISNVDAQTQTAIEPMYCLKGEGEEKKDILVSGSHLVYDATTQQFTAVKTLADAIKSEEPCPTLYCLITSDHIIPIGQRIFHDWEDSNGSTPKHIGVLSNSA